MENIISGELLKKQVLSGINRWLGYKVDEITSLSPRLSFLNPTLKRGLSNLVTHKIDSFDNLLPFITDENGNLALGDVFDEGIKMLKEMPVNTSKILNMDIEIGKGHIKLILPDNPWIDALIDKGSFIIDENDLIQLKELLMEKIK